MERWTTGHTKEYSHVDAAVRWDRTVSWKMSSLLLFYFQILPSGTTVVFCWRNVNIWGSLLFSYRIWKKGQRGEDRGKQEERRQKAEKRRDSALDTEVFCAHRTGCWSQLYSWVRDLLEKLLTGWTASWQRHAGDFCALWQSRSHFLQAWSEKAICLVVDE